MIFIFSSSRGWVAASIHVVFVVSLAVAIRGKRADEPLTYIWPLPEHATSGDVALSVDPALSLVVGGNGGGSAIVSAAFDRYKAIIFKRSDRFGFLRKLRERLSVYDIATLRIIVHIANDEVGCF